MANTSLSRLEQVFSLLENGSSAIARKAAAKQIGDVQKKHPEELNALLTKLLPYAKHSEWDTRVAGVEAIEALVKQVKKWNVDNNELLKNENNLRICEEPLMNFDDFDIEKLLLNSKTMAASSGDHMNISTDKLNKQNRLKNQRKYIDKKFGFGNNISCSLSVSSLVKDDDLKICKSDEESNNKVDLKSVKKDANMSSREKNVAMRRARMVRKQKNRENNNSIDEEEPARKQRKKSSDNATLSSDDDLENCPKHNPNQDEWEEWPFNWIYSKLVVLMFDDSWESRHGSCMAIKSVIKYHGNSIGKIKNASNNEYRHECYLNDLAIRLISVIALDRFADFVSDQVVAPVRESCAQALSVLTTFMKPKNVERVIKVLSYLRKKDDWGLRQSAIVTLQYIIAVKTDILSEILPLCLDDLIAGMYDLDGDVKSSAAKSFMPTIDLLISYDKYKDTVVSLVKVLWDSLLEYDDLTASTQSVMSLLSEVIKAVPNKSTVLGANTENLASRLSPFFVHVDEKVRRAAVNTYSTVLEVEIYKVEKSKGKIQWSDCIVVKFLSDLFCACMLERSDTLQEQLFKVFCLLVRNASKSSLDVAIQSASMWLVIMSQQMSSLFSCDILNYFPILTAVGKNNDNSLYIGGIYHCTSQITENQVHISITRHNLASMLGVLCLHSSDGILLIEPLLIPYHESPSSLQRSVASDVLSSLWKEAFYINKIPVWPSDKLHKSLDTVLHQQIYYSEVSNEVVELQKDANYYFNCLKSNGFIKTEIPVNGSYTPDNVIQLCSSLVEGLQSDSMSCNKELMEQREFLLTSAQKVNQNFACMDNRAKSYAAQVLVESSIFLCKFNIVHNLSTLWKLPVKLNYIIRPLMETIKKETNEAVVLKTSHTLSKLIEVCLERNPCPNDKLIKNLTVNLTTNRSLYPTNEYIQSFCSESVLESFRLKQSRLCRDGILTILYHRNKMEACLKKSRNTLTDPSRENISSDNATVCLKTICNHFKERILDSVGQIEKFFSLINEDDIFLTKTSDIELKVLVQAIALLSSVFDSLENTVALKVIDKYLSSLLNLLYHDYSNVRFITSNCVSLMAKHQPRHVLPSIIEEVLPEFESNNLSRRRGSVETISNIVTKLGSNIVNYAVLLVVPLLGKMGDFDPQVRLLATSCFANLIQYIPVESSIPDPLDMPHSLVVKKMEDRKFLEQLFDSRSLEEYEVPVKINAKLREYQQDGVKWLAFLNRYKLHGILCDDMGLGKTLQTICIVASDHFYKEKVKNNKNQVMSLVVCPPTLTGHWVEETLKFCDYLKPLHYYGNPTDRNRLQKQVKNYNMVVASYEVVRNDISFFSKFMWNYCILDEGHIIRNGKSKISQSVKTLKANHRLILTGTPIQNNVLELWSLFDFLIPGFLGTENEFSQKFTKPIVASRDAKCSSKEQESGLMAMNALHRQVLPFMLRRMKEDVLKDLPPKIIQDYYCNLSPLQLELYEDFAKTRAKKMAESSIKEINDYDEKSTVNKTCHVFQALQYLQKVCNHPAFVLTPNHPQYKRFCDKMKINGNKLMDIRNSCKLIALRQLLHGCGIGTSASRSVVSEHRALLFCKHKNMMDVIEHNLFKQHLPELTYTRLDASLQANQRFSIVNKFNKDPSIDVLLLSTKVGGLGLNLTGADTVIFMEHDWNPTTDLQAMDRAHRIGQKKTVTVYRIITKDTLEEKIMGLQKFKLNVANTVVSQDNRALSSMGTSQVLGLFDVGAKNEKEKKTKNSSSKGFKSMVNGLNELWEESQYEDQYNLDNFIKSMQ